MRYHTFYLLFPATIFSALVLPPHKSSGQTTDTNFPPPMNWTAEQDHQNMMDQLGIKHVRPGPDGMNPKAPNYRNTDESIANPYPNLPDPLTLDNGQKVTTAEQWWTERRPEIVEAFDREVYGRVPTNVPAVTWKVTSTTHGTNGGIPIITKHLDGHVDNSSYPLITVDIDLTVTTPANAVGPVPVMIDFGFNFAGFGGGRGRGTNGFGGFGFGGTNRPGGFGGFASGGTNRARGFGGFGGGGFGGFNAWQQEVLSNGWGYAILVPGSYQADNGAGLTRGIIGLCNKGQARKPDDWGALRAWAWGASRALDYLETDPAVDAKHVGIEGVSRYGKAALVTLAYDQRFYMGLIGSSGEGGAKLSRRNYGELVESLTGSGEYHWMAGNFLKYGGPLNAGDLPVDAHELIALCAPRLTFISDGATGGVPNAEGPWIDQHGSFMASVAAGPVFRLLGQQDLGVTNNYLTAPMPALNESITNGVLAWRQHNGGHTDGPNWPIFLEWADRYIASDYQPATN